MFFVCDLKQHPELLKTVEAYSDRMDHFRQEFEFTLKKLKNLEKERNEYKKKFFDNLFDYTKERNLLPEGATRDWYMEFNEESKHVFTKQQEESDESIPKILRDLLR